MPAESAPVDQRRLADPSSFSRGEWDYDWRNKRFQREDNTRFAVNIVVYAMTA